MCYVLPGLNSETGKKLALSVVFVIACLSNRAALACYVPSSACAGYSMALAAASSPDCAGYCNNEPFNGCVICNPGPYQTNDQCIESVMVCPSNPSSSAMTNSAPVRQTSNSCGSLIQTDTQTLVESIPIVGTPFSLVYSSAKVPGNSTWFQAAIPFTGSTVASSLVQVNMTVSVGTENSYFTDSSPAAGDVKNFTWDGKDGSGNPVSGSQPLYYSTIETNSPANPGIETASSFGAVSPFFVGFTYINWVGLGGWDVNIHHTYDNVRQVLYKGDGTMLDIPYLTSGSTYRVVSQDESEVYIFDSNWRHIYTYTGLLGTTKYTFAYTGSGQLSTITDAYSNVTTFNYTSGQLSSISAPYGQSTSVSTASVSGTYYLTAVTNPNSETYNMTYYTGGLLDTFEKPSGTTSTMTYDSSGRLLTDSSSAGSSDTLSISSTGTGVPAAGWTVSETSAMSRTGSHAMTALGNTSYTRTDTDPAGYSLSYAYDPGSANTSVGDNLNYSADFSSTSDARFGAYGQFRNYANWTNYSYSKTLDTSQSATMTGGNPFATTAYGESYDLNGNTSTLSWSSSTNKYTYQSAVGRHFYRTIDSNERTTATQLASYTPLSYSYDSNGRLSEIEQGSSRITNFAYYSSGASKGLLYTVTDALSNVTTFAYDNAGRVTSETLPDTRVIDYTYDSNGNLASVTPPGKSAHMLNHNGFDLLSSYVTPTALMSLKNAEIKTENFVNRWGQRLGYYFKKFSPSLGQKTENLFTGFTTSYTYNNDRQLTTITRPDTNAVGFSYDSTGTLSGITIPTGSNSYTFSYGKLPSTNSSIDSVSESFSFYGSLLGNLSTTFNAAGTRTSSINFTYNSDFQLASDNVASNATSGTTYSYAYDNDNLLTTAGSETLTRSSTTGFVTQTAVGSNMKVNYSYDSTYGELSEVQGKYSTTVDYEEDITRDAVGRVSSRTENYSGTSHTYAYTYDYAGRLTTVTKDSAAYESYGYDTNSNRTSQTISGTTIDPTYDGQDRLATFGTRTYTFSSSGELESYYDSGTTKTTYFTYDALGNLKSSTLASGTVITYTVDANNRRTSKKTGSTINNYFVWNQSGQLIALLNSSGAITQRYIYGTKQNVPDYMVVGSTRYQIVSNHLGSPVQVINTSNNTISEQITWDDFGNILSDSSPGFQPFGFAGCLYDNDTKLCHFGGGQTINTGSNSFGYNAGRDYDASTGRWTNRDPILFNGGDTNLFGYVLNDPVNMVDPSGTDPFGKFLVQLGVDVFTLVYDLTPSSSKFHNWVDTMRLNWDAFHLNPWPGNNDPNEAPNNIRQIRGSTPMTCER